MPPRIEARQKRQLEILERGNLTEAGTFAGLPVDLETLKNVNETSPLVMSCFKGGLTSVVYKRKVSGKYSTLKKKGRLAAAPS